MPKRRITKTYRWHDHASSSEWQSLEDIRKWVEDLKKHPCHTRGKVVYEDVDVLVVSSEHDGNGNCGNATVIWKSLIAK